MINYKITPSGYPISKVFSYYHYHNEGYVNLINNTIEEITPTVPVYYNCNDFGFRSNLNYKDLFDSGDDYITCIGCSHTRGDGLFIEESWPFILGEKLNLPVLNLGLTGGTVEYCRYQLEKLIYRNNYKQPKYIFILEPPTNRYSTLNEDEFTFFQDWNFMRFDKDDKVGKLIYKYKPNGEDMEVDVISSTDVFSNKFEVLHGINKSNLNNFIKNYNNIFLIEWDKFGEKWPLAKDQMHYDITYSQKISDSFYTLLNKKNVT